MHEIKQNACSENITSSYDNIKNVENLGPQSCM